MTAEEKFFVLPQDPKAKAALRVLRIIVNNDILDDFLETDPIIPFEYDSCLMELWQITMSEDTLSHFKERQKNMIEIFDEWLIMKDIKSILEKQKP